MTDNLSFPPKPAAKATRLPSFRVRCALAAGLFAVGTSVGAAIGPAPQSSLAQVSPKALIASLLARGAAQTRTTTTDTEPVIKASPSPSAAATDARISAGAGAAGSSPTTAPVTPASANTPSTAPAATAPASGVNGTGSPSGSIDASRLPAIRHVWLILLPGEGMASALAQPAGDPYLAQQLVPAGTLLRNYSPLAASALAADAGLLSGQRAPQESVLSAPGCNVTAEPTCTPDSAAELASVDGWLHQQIPQIIASADYRHGLIALAFCAPDAGEAGSAVTTTGSVAPAATTLPVQPVGVLLLSPFLRRPGGARTTTFHPATPRKDLEQLLRS
jgi:hypothetical protein